MTLDKGCPVRRRGTQRYFAGLHHVLVAISSLHQARTEIYAVAEMHAVQVVKISLFFCGQVSVSASANQGSYILIVGHLLVALADTNSRVAGWLSKPAELLLYVDNSMMRQVDLSLGSGGPQVTM